MSPLFEAALRSLALAIVVGLAVVTLRIRNPHIEKTLWAAVLACALAMPALMSWPPPHAIALTSALLADVVISGRRMAAHAPAAIACTLVYLAIACGLALRLAAGFVRMGRMRRSAVPVHEAWTAGLDVRVSASLAGPVTFGSVILLPADFAGWSEGKRTAILAHEREHVLARDCAVQWLAAVHVCVFWFSPLSWWLRNRLARLAEYSSDDAALRETRNPADYAAVLLDAANARCVARTAIAMASAGSIAYRMDRILSRRELYDAPALWRRALAAALVLPVVALAAGTPGVQVRAAVVQQDSSHSGSGSQPDASGPKASIVSDGEGSGKWYPERAKREGRNGLVRIAVTLDVDGRPTDSVIVSVSPEGLGFAQAATQAVRTFTYSNPTGHPTTIVFNVTFELLGQSSGAPPAQHYGTTNFEGR